MLYSFGHVSQLFYGFVDTRNTNFMTIWPSTMSLSSVNASIGQSSA